MMNSQDHFSRVDIYISLILAGLCLSLSLLLIPFVPFPGHGDPCYYVDLARNLAENRGFVIDYISYYDDDEFDGLASELTVESLNLGYVTYF